MPRKKRVTDDDKRKNVITKLVFTSMIASLVLLTNFLVIRQRSKSNTTIQTASKESSNTASSGSSSTGTSDAQVLGERIVNEDQLKDEFGKVVSAAQDQATSAQKELEGVAEGALETGKKQAEKTISAVIYENTIKPLLDKINDLPADQQKVIREAVCK